MYDLNKTLELIAREYIFHMEENTLSLKDIDSFLKLNWKNYFAYKDDIKRIIENIENSEGVESASLFGDVVFAYSRRNAIEDGILIDKPLGRIAAKYGIRIHSAMTVNLYKLMCPQDKMILEENIDNLVLSFIESVRGKDDQNSDIKLFDTIIKTSHNFDNNIQREIKVVIGPGDDEQPVLTFMLPDED